MADEPKEPKPPQVPRAKSPLAVHPLCRLLLPSLRRERAAAPPKAAAPAPPRPPVVLQTPLDNELVKRFRAKFGGALLDATEDPKQAS